jgi:hypothetical protein
MLIFTFSSKHVYIISRCLSGEFFFFLYIYSPSRRSRPYFFQGSSIPLRHTTLDMIHMDEWSARCRDLYLTTHSIHKKQTSTLPAGEESTIPANERPQTGALNRAATVFGHCTKISQDKHLWPGSFSPTLVTVLRLSEKNERIREKDKWYNEKWGIMKNKWINNVSQVVSFPQVSPPKPCTRRSPPPYALHAPLISFFSILSLAQ